MNDYYLEKSDNKKHKYMVHFINPETNNINTIRFGAKGMSDYTIHKDEERKERYIKRHQKREDWTNLEKPSSWALNILWNKKTLKASIKDMEKKFGIKIWLIE
jgi:hypothetical protein